MAHQFALRSPWYVRERGKFGLDDPRALRPAIQKYDTSDFVSRLLADPRASLKFDRCDDVWSYPVPVGFPGPGKGRERLSSFRSVHTGLRKLYQPSHSRFYVVVVEVFCDEPGLPRATSHDDIEVRLVMRRHNVRLRGPSRPIRRLARDLMVTMVENEYQVSPTDRSTRDVDDLWWAAEFERYRNTDTAIEVKTVLEAWTGDRWRPTADLGKPDVPAEETFPMWRLPRRPPDCADRSLWFGLVPTYSAAVDVSGAPKLDDRSIYDLRCFVRQNRGACLPLMSWTARPTRQFRLAPFFDPDGTKNHRVSITMPDFRALAARTAQPAGPGGVRITTPPGSQLVFDPDLAKLKPGAGSIGVGGTCTFALELFMIVAFFLFSLFLPIVVFVFQLWWMLALRFCLVPEAAFKLLEDFFKSKVPLSDLVDPLDADYSKHQAERDALDSVLGARGSAARVKDAPDLIVKPDLVPDLVTASDPSGAAKPKPPAPEPKPEDPLCR